MPGWLSDNWRNAVDVVGVVATVAAAWLAWWAIRNGNRQAKRSADALVRERRLDFELDRLIELDDAVGAPSNLGAVRVRRCLRLLPTDELPHVRALFNVDSPAGAVAVLVELRAAKAKDDYRPEVELPLPDGRTYGDAMHAELRDAIQQRVNARD
jgi:hypothetical protein